MMISFNLTTMFYIIELLFEFFNNADPFPSKKNSVIWVQKLTR